MPSVAAICRNLPGESPQVTDVSAVRIVSKERREVVELAERILDRVTRIHFERKRLLTRLWSLPKDRAGERGSLLLEARELGATLEGLTGGAFTRLRQAEAR